jgi:hypothetical protein
MRTRCGPSFLLLGALLLLGPALPAQGEISDFGPNRCTSGKAGSLGKAAAALLRCHAKAAKQGLPADAACLDKVSDKLTGGEVPERGAFGKLERKGDCATEGDAAAFDASLTDLARQVDGMIATGSGGRCDSARLGCAGKYLGAALKCYSRAARGSGAASCLAGPAADLAQCEAKAEAKGDCSADVSADDVRTLGEERLQGWLCGLDSGAGPGCTSGNKLEEFLPAGSLGLQGVDPAGFNSVSAPLRFVLLGARFSALPEDTTLSVNGDPVDPTSLVYQPHEIRAEFVLVDGKNEISFSAVDEFGRPLYLQAVLWAGGQQLEVLLVDENDRPVKGKALVRAALADDQSVVASARARKGRALFENVPASTVLFEAKTRGLYGLVGAIGTQGVAQMRMSGLLPPSAVDNNDFALGLDGWSVDGANVAITPHEEVAGLVARGPANNDLSLGTSGEGEQAVARSFDTEPGTSSVRVRYRFVTSEVPGGYFGSQYNDYFRVSIRSRAGGQAGESNTMNGLGLAAFDANGATEWRDQTLNVDPAGDTIQVDVAVANVADGEFDSQVVVDFVEEVKDQVRPQLAWDRTNGGLRLTFEVVDGALEEETSIEVFFATGTGYANRTGAALFTHVVAAGTPQGQHGPVQIDGQILTGDAAGTTHFLAAASETSVGAVADVQIAYGANANAAVVSAGMLTVVRESLRVAGQANATINSTARSPADQARAMFNNLVNPGTDGVLTLEEVTSNVNVQKNGNGTGDFTGYGAAGDAVIDVFVAEIADLTAAEILADATAIKTTMEGEIDAQGPTSVSKHCSDPALISVVDVGAAAFSATNGLLFVAEAESRVTNFLDERGSNGCYHLEL